MNECKKKDYLPTICLTLSYKMATHRSYKTSSYFTTSGNRDTSKRPHTKSSYPSHSSSSLDEDIIISTKGLAIQSRTKDITSTSNSSTNSPRCGTPNAHGMLRFYLSMQAFPAFYQVAPPPPTV